MVGVDVKTVALSWRSCGRQMTVRPEVVAYKELPMVRVVSLQDPTIAPYLDVDDTLLNRDMVHTPCHFPVSDESIEDIAFLKDIG